MWRRSAGMLAILAVAVAGCSGQGGLSHDGGKDVATADAGGADTAADQAGDVAVDQAGDVAVDRAGDAAVDAVVTDVGTPDVPLDNSTTPDVPTDSSGASDGSVAPDSSDASDGGPPDGSSSPTYHVQEFVLPTQGTPSWIAAGSDGNVWFTEGSASIWRCTPTGQITEFGPFGTDDDPITLGAITSGPDGNLWIADSNFGHVARLTTAGVLTAFALPSDAALPETVIAGPDGNLWFVGTSKPAICRITPAGVLTSFPVPSGNVVNDITTGPDGNLWFAENGIGIGHISPGGTDLVEIPLAENEVGHMTTGPDGNLWFTENFLGRIVRVTPTGVTTVFPTPSSGSRPIGIVAGPDGNLWVGEGRLGFLARVTPAGDITEVPVPHLGVIRVIVGPGGNIWFTFTSDDSLAYIKP